MVVKIFLSTTAHCTELLTFKGYNGRDNCQYSRFHPCIYVIIRKLECIRMKYYHRIYRRNVHDYVSGKGPGTAIQFLYIGHLIHYNIILSTTPIPPYSRSRCSTTCKWVKSILASRAHTRIFFCYILQVVHNIIHSCFIPCSSYYTFSHGTKFKKKLKFKKILM